jgi:two-component system, response regulator
MTGEPIKFILLAEDDAVVAELIMHVLAARVPAPQVVHVRDGVETLDFLHARERFRDRAPGNPSVVLLDVKMPRLDGLDVLRHVKGDAQLRTTPVVMLTSSQDERDIQQSYDLGANAYVVKPVEFRLFSTVLEQLETFWLRVNQPPLDPNHGVAAARALSGSHEHDPPA